MILNQIEEMKAHVNDILNYVHNVTFNRTCMSFAVGSRLYGFSQSVCHINSVHHTVSSYAFEFTENALSITVKSFDGTYTNIILEKLEDN